VSLLISNATLIDGVAKHPIAEQSLLIDSGRFKAIGSPDEVGIPPGVEVIDARGKFIIPGLMDANVHLLQDMRMENLVRYEDRYMDLIAEAAQLALKSGLTTVFDTWGPRQPLMEVRDKINSGQMPGSRIFCAGNIVGLDGPFSADFIAKATEVASPSLIERINGLWAENVGPALSWMTPKQVVQEIRRYISKGIDFIKYAASEHRWGTPTTFLVFSPEVQAAIVAETHRAGLTAQAHTMSVESLRIAIEAGCDLIQHCNITGPVLIPSSTLDLIAKRKTGAVVFPFTQRRRDLMMEKGDAIGNIFSSGTVDTNVLNLMQSGATLLLATDAGIWAPEAATDPFWSAAITGEDNLIELGQGHFHWLKAMEEKGLQPMEMLWAATRNIAVAYQKDKDLGTIETGKIADLLILEKDPLQSAEHYRSIHVILKDGAVVDRLALPLNPILTRPAANSCAETLAYRAHRSMGNSRHPFCC
jgi:imidazolonepropionase-like amidohydrolase